MKLKGNLCVNLSNYEVEISYKTEEFFYKLRKAWEESITKEPLEDINWRLLKQLEYLMVKEFLKFMVDKCTRGKLLGKSF